MLGVAMQIVGGELDAIRAEPYINGRTLTVGISSSVDILTPDGMLIISVPNANIVTVL